MNKDNTLFYFTLLIKKPNLVIVIANLNLRSGVSHDQNIVEKLGENNVEVDNTVESCAL